MRERCVAISANVLICSLICSWVLRCVLRKKTAEAVGCLRCLRCVMATATFLRYCRMERTDGVTAGGKFPMSLEHNSPQSIAAI